MQLHANPPPPSPRLQYLYSARQAKGIKGDHPLLSDSFCPQVPEYAATGLSTALLLFSGNFFSGACQLAMLAFLIHLYIQRKVYVDSMDAFRQLPGHKQQRIVLLVGSLALFVLIMYR